MILLLTGFGLIENMIIKLELFLKLSLLNFGIMFVFYGTKRGAELDEIYDKCNIAVASLGMSRIGYKTANSLKIREYLAKGLPIITACNIDLFEKHSFKYECKFSNDESSIDIKKIIDFFDNTYLTNNEQFIIDDIREYSEEYCDMSYAMNNVINFIKNVLILLIIYFF